jgi:hypothetical protein
MALMKTGFVYKLVSKDINVKECYVGSTGNITKRKNYHKSDCNKATGKNYNFRVYQYIRDNSGFANWDMIVLETVQYDQKYELKARERYHMEALGATLNTQTPGQTKSEYYANNKDTVLERVKHWAEKNTDKTKQYKTEYYASNKDTVLERVKQWAENNTEKVHISKRKYWENNKEKINQKHNCECNGKYTNSGKSQHMKTARHKTYMEHNKAG